MPEERARILELLREGRITVEEAEQLLDALGPAGEQREAEGEPPLKGLPSRLCVRITDLRTGKIKTDVRLPFGAWGLLSKLTRTRLGRHIGGLALHEIKRAARGRTSGHIVDVTNDERDERVEVFFEPPPPPPPPPPPQP